MNPISIRKVDVLKTSPTVRGQIIRKWYEKINGVDGFGLMFILQDEAGDKIEVRAFGNIKDRFGREFREYDHYMIRGFTVVPIDDNVEPIQFSLTHNPRRIYLTPQSQVNHLFSLSPDYDENYTPFADLKSSVLWSGGMFVNLMGVVLDVGKLHNEKINFRLVDIKGSAFKCYAKGMCALQIQKISGKHPYAGVCILRFCFAKEEEGDVVIAVDRPVSEILVNPWTKPALELRSRMLTCFDEYMYDD